MNKRIKKKKQKQLISFLKSSRKSGRHFEYYGMTTNTIYVPFGHVGTTNHIVCLPSQKTAL